MKKLLCSFFTIPALVFIIYSASFAQEDDTPFQIGAGLLFGSEVEELGFQINVNYPILQNIELAPDFSIYFADDELGIDSYWELNVNGHYFLEANDEYNIYGLGGLNITTVGNSISDESDTEAGINVGLGGEYYLNLFSIYGELKYILSDFDQLVLGAGVRIPFSG